MEANYLTILYWFCHTSTCIHHRCTRVPNPEPPSHRPPHTIPLGHPSAPAPSFLYPASNLDWLFVSYMILYMFQCHYPKSSPAFPLPQSPKDCSIHLCLFCSNPIAGHTHQGNQNWKRHMYPSVYRSTVYNSQDMETTWMCISRWMDKKAVVHIHNGVLLSHHKEYIWISSNEVDETGADYTELSKPERKTPIQNAYF